MRILNFVAAATVSLLATTALAAEGVGEALAVIDAASASGQAGDRTLAVGSRVFVGDLVATDSVGEAQLLFSDGTRMVVGSNSSLVIDEFLFRGNAVENKFAVRALGGAFRFISGESGDQGYSIRTPTATIGVRGTAFDFTVTPSGGTKIVLLQGEASLCGEGGECETIATPCELLQTDDGKDVEEVDVGDDRLKVTRANFPYVRSDAALLAAFQIEGHGCADADPDRDPAEPERSRAEADRDPPSDPGTGTSDADSSGASGSNSDGSSSSAGPGGANSNR